jgi:hypothetical protein
MTKVYFKTLKNLGYTSNEEEEEEEEFEDESNYQNDNNDTPRGFYDRIQNAAYGSPI